MIKIKNKSLCCGCHGCANICPQKCISMKSDDEGFLYPVIDENACTNCGLCEKVCHILNPTVCENQPKMYACYNTDEDVRHMSSSGGIFTLIAENVINKGGVVFGAAFDDTLAVKHIMVDNKEDLDKLRGSKYLQSTIGNTYIRVKEILKTGQIVLFTGTPCQIDGLVSYLGKDYDNLFTQDIICHGVPSPKVWQKYIDYHKSLQKSSIDTNSAPSFRSKEHGWSLFRLHINFENGEKYTSPFTKDLFMTAFLNNLCLRPSCYNCKSKGIKKKSDITLADFWGIDKSLPEMFDEQLFDEIKDFTVYKKTIAEVALKNNWAAIKSSYRPVKRKKFMKNIENTDFKTLCLTCKNKTLTERIIFKLKSKLKF